MNDYNNTNRTDVQDQQRREAIKKEDKDRQEAHDAEDRERKEEREREQQALQTRWLALARREEAVLAKEDAIRDNEERRKRAGVRWWDLAAEERCLGYDKRMYHAELVRVPAGENAQNWCMSTSIDIHGITYNSPDLCTHHKQVVSIFSPLLSLVPTSLTCDIRTDL